MDSSKDKETAKQAFYELFPEEMPMLGEAKAEELLQYIQPKLDGMLSELSVRINEDIQSIRQAIDANSTDELKKAVSSLTQKISMLDKVQSAISILGEGQKSLNEKIDSSFVSAKEIAYRGISLINELKPRVDALEEQIGEVNTRIDDLPKPYNDKDIQESVRDLRALILSRPTGGGGGAYRNIAIGGNSSVLSRYNDLNIKAGSNVTLSFTNNNTTKFLDLTISATGGSGSGIVRSVNNTSLSLAADSASTTDYVYVCSAGVQITMPDATTNTNLYTIKNTSNSSVLISTTSAQTIDGSVNLILATQFTSVDLSSNGSNWDIT